MSSERSTEQQAKRLRELMRNRFSQEIAVRLVEEFGGEQQALDFVLNGEEKDVKFFLRESPGYIQDLRKDSQNLASILENGFESSVRMFGCGSCQRLWWKRVPARKEVSTCNRCNVKYDPIPRDKEWGWGKFICSCGNEFTSYAKMGETHSECYECGEMCPVHHILPPRRRPNKTRRSNAPHTCDAVDCYNRDDGWYCPPQHKEEDVVFVPVTVPVNTYQGEVPNVNTVQGEGEQQKTGETEPGPGTCVHPKSQRSQRNRRKLHWTSQRHTSSGSTVTDVMSQFSIDTASVSSSLAFCSIAERDGF